MTVRRVAAVVVGLAAALLMHFALPHHAATSATSPPLVAMAESESRKTQDVWSPHHRTGVGGQHQDEVTDAPARPPRALVPEAEPLACHAVSSGTAVSAARPGTARPRTAREAGSPTSGATPNITLLQSFRC